MPALEKGDVIAVMGDFKDPNRLISAAKSIHAAGYTKFDIYTPYPVHGLEKAMGVPKTSLPKFALAGGLFGLLCAFALQYWTGAIEYKLNIGGKPLFAPQFGVPVFFELTVLCTGLTVFFVMFGYLNRLPNWHSKYQYDEGFQAATDDNFCVVLEANDPRFTVENAQELLRRLGADNVRVVHETIEQD
ncbi:MAG: DUF3341 domain-containing protein [Bacteroidota bacterium]|nr:DUF3341 domain-containing protein [Candidatus Kapabacteria bacterium]MDW8219421.1 DUF3341 domain-containing protein [Bacteroidota bacterium]